MTATVTEQFASFVCLLLPQILDLVTTQPIHTHHHPSRGRRG